MALVTKILEQTLTAGQTAVVFTDTDIPNSLIRVFSSNSDIIPVSRVLSGNSLTVTYAPQTFNMDVALEIAKQGLEIVDNVTSSDTDKALSAKQGKVLKDAIDTTDDNLSDLATVVNNLDIPYNITDLDDVDVTSIQDDQVLAWDSVAEKFKNVTPSGSGIALTTKAWTATASTAAGTVLTETATLTNGLYLVIGHSPYVNNSTLVPLGLSINNTLDVNTIAYVSMAYGVFTNILQIETSSTVSICSVSSNSMSWDNATLSRGGMYIIKLT